MGIMFLERGSRFRGGMVVDEESRDGENVVLVIKDNKLKRQVVDKDVLVFDAREPDEPLPKKSEWLSEFLA